MRLYVHFKHEKTTCHERLISLNSSQFHFLNLLTNFDIEQFVVKSTNGDTCAVSKETI